MEIAIVIGLLLLAVALFATEKIPVDIVTVFLLIVLVVSGILTSKEAFAPFASDFIVMLASIFVITYAIETSGVLDSLADIVSRKTTSGDGKLSLWTMPFTGFISTFMNNTTVTALLIPPLLSLARKSRTSPSKVLMPMAFASIVGGTCSLIGTSTNIAVSGYLAREGYVQLSIFSITPIGLVLMALFMVYMIFIGRHLLPDRQSDQLTERYQVREYMSEVKILPDSNLIGQRVYDSSLASSGFRILGIIRESHKFYPGPNAVFFAGDVVLVTGNIKDLLAVKDKNGIDILADVLEKFYSNDNKDPLQLREVLIPANSTLTGKSVKSADFRRRYGLAVVAINRASETLTDKIGSIELQVGDVLLVQGTADRLADFHDEHNLILMGEHEVNPNRVRKGWLAIGIFLVAVVLSSFKIIPTDIAFLGAALSTVVFRIIKPGEVYGNIDWRLLVLIGGMSAFGTAMKNSGADVFISDFFISIFKGLGPGGIMLGFMIITVLLTQPMSNAAAALVVLPIALQSAESLQVNPVTFGVAVMLSASVSVMTPFEPSCILIYSPGKYRFADFMRVGGGLTLILVVAIYFLVPMFWPLQ